MDIFIFRRDLRIVDNVGLSSLKKAYPIFIFDPIQIEPKNNKYYSESLVQFMYGALNYLKSKINLTFFYGEPVEVLRRLHKKKPIRSITFNLDYSPFSKERDRRIGEFCKSSDIKLATFDDLLLVPPDKVAHQKKFSTFLKKNKKKINQQQVKAVPKTFKINTSQSVKLPKGADVSYGDAVKILKNYDFKQYVKARDLLTEKTTELSPYINLGVISIRQVYSVKNKKFREELIWRDFYYHAMNKFGKTLLDGYRPYKYGKLAGRRKKLFKAWKNGTTGVPIVDAIMRKLKHDHYVGNRARMITASYLINDLGVDWKLGERYFATQLRDYNISANNGGWQWISKSGVNYTRWVFSMQAQTKKHDPSAAFIKKWVPELRDRTAKEIINMTSSMPK